MQSNLIPPSPLQGRGILVTRPKHQAATLIRQLEDAGARAYPFPVIEILPPLNLLPATQQFQRLEQIDILIFISANAARIGLQWINEQTVLPDSIAIAAVGQATSRALQQLGVSVDILPTERFDSEGLLDTPQLRTVEGKKILIVRGEGGRELLASRLRERGATVDYAETYRRTLPETDPAPILRAWQQKQIDAAIVTSNQGLDNLIQIIGADGHADLLQTPLVVISERTREVARNRGFIHPPLLTQNPSEGAILDTLCHGFSSREWLLKAQ
ncbi:MAG: uroporphyrinogen-III synthase [Gammaproteobacteria bacterium]|nr:uroporphyrinogen-III synthase [Gammaproteobacteria bacterium]MBT7307758.1 uroporphyrinogen-III synthase [Gammaproteobacteria bacterium]